MWDVNYDNVSLAISESDYTYSDNYWEIDAFLHNTNEDYWIMGIYDSKEKAERIVADILEASYKGRDSFIFSENDEVEI